MAAFDRVTVVGAGDMGHGFAVQFGRHGIETTLVDHRESNLDDARDRIDRPPAAALAVPDALADRRVDGAVGDSDGTTAAAPADD